MHVRTWVHSESAGERESTHAYIVHIDFPASQAGLRMQSCVYMLVPVSANAPTLRWGPVHCSPRSALHITYHVDVAQLKAGFT